MSDVGFIPEVVGREMSLNPASAADARGPLDTAHASINLLPAPMMPLTHNAVPSAPGQFEEPSDKTPPLATQESGMVVCPLCPAPGYVPRTDQDHARNMHR